MVVWGGFESGEDGYGSAPRIAAPPRVSWNASGAAATAAAAPPSGTPPAIADSSAGRNACPAGRLWSGGGTAAAAAATTASWAVRPETGQLRRNCAAARLARCVVS